MSATSKTTLTIQYIKALSNELKEPLLKAEYVDNKAKIELQSILDRISALAREDLDGRELDAIKAFLDYVQGLTSSLDEGVCGQLIERCHFFKHRVLSFAELSKNNIAQVAVNDLLARSKELLTALEDPEDIKKIPASLTDLSLEGVLKVCSDIDTARKDKMYASVEALISALNALKGKREYWNEEKYAGFRRALSAIGIVYSRQTNSFSCQYDKPVTMIVLEDPFDCSLPAAGNYWLDSERDKAEAELRNAWDCFMKEHATYRSKYSEVPETSRLDALKYHAEALDRRIEVQCEHCMQKIGDIAHGGVRLKLYEWLRLEMLLDAQILPYHEAMKGAFHEGMLDLLIELETVLDKTRNDNTEEELNILLDKILKLRAPVVKALLSKERVALPAEENSVRAGERELAEKSRIYDEKDRALALAGENLSLQEKKFRDQSSEYEEVQPKIKTSLEALEKVKAQVSVLTGEKRALESTQQKMEEERGALDARIETETATVAAKQKAYDDADGSLKQYADALATLGDSDDNMQQALDALDRAIDDLKTDRSMNAIEVPQGFTAFSDHLNDWGDFQANQLSLNALDEHGYGVFADLSGSLHDILSGSNQGGLASFFSSGQENIGKIAEIFFRLRTQLATSSAVIRNKELKRLKDDVLADIKALTEKHTHLAEKPTGFFSRISRALFRSDTTKQLANQLAAIKVALDSSENKEGVINEGVILEQIEAFKKLLANSEFKRSGTTDGENSRQAHMEYLHSRWQHEGEEALSLYVGSAVKPIMQAMQQCNQFKNQLQSARDAKKREVTGLGNELKAAEKKLEGSRFQMNALEESLGKTGEEIGKLADEESEARAEVTKLNTTIQNLKSDAEVLKQQIDSFADTKKVLEDKEKDAFQEFDEAQKALAQKRAEIEPRRAVVESRRKALQDTDVFREQLGQTYFAATEPEQPEAPSAPQSISENKKRISTLEGECEDMAGKILFAIELFINNEGFDKEDVFSADETYSEDDLHTLKCNMQKMYKTLDEYNKNKDFDSFYRCATTLLKEYKHQVDDIFKECPNNAVMNELADNFPNCDDFLQAIGEKNVALKDLRENLSVLSSEQQKELDVIESMLKREALSQKRRSDALREERKKEKSEELAQKQTLKPHKVQELPPPLSSKLSKEAKEYSAQQVPPNMKTGHGHDPHFFASSSQKGVAGTTSGPSKRNGYEK